MLEKRRIFGRMNLFDPNKDYDTLWKEAYAIRERENKIVKTASPQIILFRKSDGKNINWKKIECQSYVKGMGNTTLKYSPYNMEVIFYYKGDSDDDLTKFKNWYVKAITQDTYGKNVEGYVLADKYKGLLDNVGANLVELAWLNQKLEITVSPKNLPPTLYLGKGAKILNGSQYLGSMPPIFFGESATFNEGAQVAGGIIDDNVLFGAGTRILGNSIFGPSYIGDNVLINHGTIIEEGATIRFGGRITNGLRVGKRGILGANSYTVPYVDIPSFTEISNGTPDFLGYFWERENGFNDHVLNREK